MKRTFLAVLFLASGLQAAQISSVSVNGETEANLKFEGLELRTDRINYAIKNNTIELNFNGTTLAETLKGKVDLEAPHALVHRVSLYESGTGSVKGIIVLNGTMENIKNRINVANDANAISFRVEYPKGDNAALKLLKEEQQPLKTPEIFKKKTELGTLHWGQLLMVLLVIVGAGVTSFFVVRFMKTKGNWKGSRKYLVENLSTMPLGDGKAAVSLIKVGTEFILVGVTPNQVSFLSKLPQLSQQYQDENKFERNTFNEAIEEELQKKPFNA